MKNLEAMNIRYLRVETIYQGKEMRGRIGRPYIVLYVYITFFPGAITPLRLPCSRLAGTHSTPTFT